MLLLPLALGTLGGAPAHARDAPPRLLAAERVTDVEESARVKLEQVTVNGLVFDVRTAGPVDGEVVFLLHGFPQTSYQWRHQLPVLANAGYRVIAPDLRGYSPGARPEAVIEYNLVNFLDDLLKTADHYGAERFHVVGHDVGGMVAWGMGQLFPGKLKSLTVLSVPHPAAFAAQLADQDGCQRKASWWYLEVMKPGAGARALAGDPPDLLDAWSAMAPDAQAEYRRVLGSPDALEATFKMWRANFDDDLVAPAAQPLPVVVPTMYIRGDRDPNNCGDGEPMTRRLCPVSYRFEELAGIGHWISEEAPDALNRLLLEHLGRHD